MCDPQKGSPATWLVVVGLCDAAIFDSLQTMQRISRKIQFFFFLNATLFRTRTHGSNALRLAGSLLLVCGSGRGETVNVVVTSIRGTLFLRLGAKRNGAKPKRPGGSSFYLGIVEDREGMFVPRGDASKT